MFLNVQEIENESDNLARQLKQTAEKIALETPPDIRHLFDCYKQLRQFIGEIQYPAAPTTEISTLPKITSSSIMEYIFSHLQNSSTEEGTYLILFPNQSKIASIFNSVLPKLILAIEVLEQTSIAAFKNNLVFDFISQIKEEIKYIISNYNRALTTIKILNRQEEKKADILSLIEVIKTKFGELFVAPPAEAAFPDVPAISNPLLNVIMENERQITKRSENAKRGWTSCLKQQIFVKHLYEKFSDWSSTCYLFNRDMLSFIHSKNIAEGKHEILTPEKEELENIRLQPFEKNFKRIYKYFLKLVAGVQENFSDYRGEKAVFLKVSLLLNKSAISEKLYTAIILTENFLKILDLAHLEENDSDIDFMERQLPLIRLTSEASNHLVIYQDCIALMKRLLIIETLINNPKNYLENLNILREKHLNWTRESSEVNELVNTLVAFIEEIFENAFNYNISKPRHEKIKFNFWSNGAPNKLTNSAVTVNINSNESKEPNKKLFDEISKVQNSPHTSMDVESNLQSNINQDIELSKLLAAVKTLNGKFSELSDSLSSKQNKLIKDFESGFEELCKFDTKPFDALQNSAKNWLATIDENEKKEPLIELRKILLNIFNNARIAARFITMCKEIKTTLKEIKEIPQQTGKLSMKLKQRQNFLKSFNNDPMLLTKKITGDFLELEQKFLAKDCPSNSFLDSARTYIEIIENNITTPKPTQMSSFS